MLKRNFRFHIPVNDNVVEPWKNIDQIKNKVMNSTLINTGPKITISLN